NAPPRDRRFAAREGEEIRYREEGEEDRESALTRAAILVPGFGGGAEQPILRRVSIALAEHGIAARAIEFSTRGSRPSKEYLREIGELRAARDALSAEGATRIALVGRSFGGRICAFLAETEPPDALVILGHPISPPGRPRPRDEAALAAVRCPTLVVQGDRDELGPLDVLERIAAANPLIELVVVPRTGHGLGAQAGEALSHAAGWIAEKLGPA
ncbi:MAG: alpha/beta family hydrolase, partial [Chloroflexota bacterium]